MPTVTGRLLKPRSLIPIFTKNLQKHESYHGLSFIQLVMSLSFEEQDLQY